MNPDTLDLIQSRAAHVVPGGVNQDVVLLCEHGGNAVPAPWADLGLHAALLTTHFGWDIGAAAVTLEVARTIGATAIVAAYSRLFLDYNRKRHDPDAFKMEMGGIPIPGNADIDETEIELRESIARAPVERAVAEWTENKRARAIVSIHSFTPLWQNARRSCEIGVMWRNDSRLAPRLIEELGRHGKYRVESNQPYDFRTNDWYTLDRHGLKLDIPCAYVELRSNLIDSEQGVQDITSLMSTALLDSLAGMTEGAS